MMINALAIAAFSVVASVKCVHMLQIESYQSNMYLKWLVRSGFRPFLPYIVAATISILTHYTLSGFYRTMPDMNVTVYASDAVHVLLLLAIGIINRFKKYKKSFVITTRVKRLLVALFLMYAASNYLFIVILDNHHLFVVAVRYAIASLIPLIVMAGNYIVAPVERLIHCYYFSSARRKIKSFKNLSKICIVGSYGKTTTKYALNAILSKRYKTIMTPSSVNTPMGIARVVREDLKEDHEIFIIEMGERYEGDIDELCKMLNPQYALVTDIGKQHLETFGTQESIISTISEVMDNLPQDGVIFFNGDSSICKELYDKCELGQKYLFGIEDGDNYLTATSIQTTKRGSAFEINTSNGETMSCTTKLLGKHNIRNVLGASAVAKYFCLSMLEIQEGIAAVDPISHRLEVLPGEITVIDNTYSSNPAGAKAALEVLMSFAPSKKIVITPGMIELGKEEKMLNREYGVNMAGVADVVILIGKKRTAAIAQGLKDAKFPEDRIIAVGTLDEAVKILPMYVSSDSVVLFENDLPDTYS